MTSCHLALVLLLSGLSGCEAVGPNEIGTWTIFHEDRAKIVYTGSEEGGAVPSAGETVPEIVGSIAASPLSAPLPNALPTNSAPLVNDRSADWSTGVDTDFQHLLHPAPPMLKDFTELGPFPSYPIIDIAEIRSTLAAADSTD